MMSTSMPDAKKCREIALELRKCPTMYNVTVADQLELAASMVERFSRSRDDLARLIGENAADNYLSFPDEQSHAVLVRSLVDVTAERDQARAQVARLTRELCGVPVDGSLF